MKDNHFYKSPSLFYQVIKLIRIVYVLNFIDLIVTYIGVNRFGLVAESNSNIIFLLENFGWFSLIFVKVYILPLFFIPVIETLKRIDLKYKRKYESIVSLYLLILICMFITIIIDWVVILIK